MGLRPMSGRELRAAADFLWDKGFKEQASILHDVARLAEADERAALAEYDPVAEAQRILRESL